MGPNKEYRLGDLVSVVDERNNIGNKKFYGVNINKEFMPTAANTLELDESKYKIVRKNRFVFSSMQTGRDECIRISMYDGSEPIIVSPAYVTFEVLKTDLVLPEYFFMIFLSKEKDRLGWFHSCGSVRSNLDWGVFCKISITLPPLSAQQKAVAVYNGLKENLAAYESGLSDLKLTCDGFIEELRRKYVGTKLRQYIKEVDCRNEDALDLSKVRGISTEKNLIETKANMQGVNLDNYKELKPNQFVYVADTSRRGDKIALALNDTEETFLVSSIYTVFEANQEELCPEYLMMFFSRPEFDRYSRFHSWGSARETFDWSEMCNVKIPLPDIKIQQSIADIYGCYIERKRIAAELREELKNICPLLLRGALMA